MPSTRPPGGGDITASVTPGGAGQNHSPRPANKLRPSLLEKFLHVILNKY